MYYSPTEEVSIMGMLGLGGTDAPYIYIDLWKEGSFRYLFCSGTPFPAQKGSKPDFRVWGAQDASAECFTGKPKAADTVVSR